MLFPPSARTQLPQSEALRARLAKIPDGFISDGCSNSPDSIFGFDLAWACELHDCDYCSRCHEAGDMTQSRRREADLRLRRYIGEALPWRWRWIKWVYWRVLKTAGGVDAWNSCGPNPWGDPTELNEAEFALYQAGLCRHGIARPEWQELLAEGVFSH